MRILPVTDLVPRSSAGAKWDETIQEAIEVLREGGVVAHATETCYGFACDLQNPEAVTKLFKIKERPYDKPVSGLFATVDDAKEVAEWNDDAEKLAAEHLPGPLTIILPLFEPKRFFVTPNGGTTIGVRVSSHPVAKALAMEFAAPISTTSANFHGKPNPYTVADILMQLRENKILPDLILDSGALPPVKPSTVIDCTGDPVELRGGNVKIWK